MKFNKTFLYVVLSAFMVTLPFANAADDMGPHEVVNISVQKVMTAIEEGRDSYEEQPEKLNHEIMRVLEPIVAFDSISYAVMGKYKKQATIQQKQKFAKVFKETMVKLYAKALVTFESENIIVLPPKAGKSYTKKAKVFLNVKGEDGTLYKVTYSMRKNKKSQWQARNVIVDGINLGLTYLNQFDSAMNRHNKDIDKVIESWAQDMQEVKK